MLLGRTLWRPGDKQIAICDHKNIYKNFSLKFFQIFGHQIPGSWTGTAFT
jgi:hypothetical protein